MAMACRAVVCFTRTSIVMVYDIFKLKGEGAPKGRGLACIMGARSAGPAKSWYSPPHVASKNRFWPILPALILAVVLAAYAGSGAPEPAPRFRARTMDGESFNNESLKGKVVLLEFWTTWCKYCREEEALVDDINHEFASKGLAVLAIDIAESKKKVKKYLEENPRSCRIVLMRTRTSLPCTRLRPTRYTLLSIVTVTSCYATRSRRRSGPAPASRPCWAGIRGVAWSGIG